MGGLIDVVLCGVLCWGDVDGCGCDRNLCIIYGIDRICIICGVMSVLCCGIVCKGVFGVCST
jgi:hypothetical protein